MAENKDDTPVTAHILMRIRSASEAARVHANALKVEQHQEKVAQAAGLVQEAERLMARGWSKIRVLRSTGLSIAIPQSTAGELARLTKKGAELAEADVEALVDPRRFEMNRLERQVKALVPKLDEAAEAAWNQYWPEQLPKVEELLNVLGNLNAYRTKVAEFRRLDADTRRRAERVPFDEKQWQDFHNDAGKLRQAATQFTAELGEALPKAVANFLRRSGSPAGATLHDLTDTVRDWLREHDVEADFVVIVRGTSGAIATSTQFNPQVRR